MCFWNASVCVYVYGGGVKKGGVHFLVANECVRNRLRSSGIFCPPCELLRLGTVCRKGDEVNGVVVPQKFLGHLGELDPTLTLACTPSPAFLLQCFLASCERVCVRSPSSPLLTGVV